MGSVCICGLVMNMVSMMLFYDVKNEKIVVVKMFGSIEGMVICSFVCRGEVL